MTDSSRWHGEMSVMRGKTMVSFANRKKVLYLYNGKAGKKTFSKDISGEINCAIESLCENGYEVTVYPIIPESGLTSENILSEIGGRYDLAMVCGGDGTLNHVINGLMQNHLKLPLAYVPLGSTNDFSKSLYGAGNHSMSDFCGYIADGHTFTYDTGKFNDSYFNYVAGFGAFPTISFTTSQELKNAVGYTAYVLKFLSELPDGLSYSKHCRIVHDGITEEGNFMFGLITNSISVAGMQPGVIKMSSLNDGVFEATVVKAGLDAIKIADVLRTLNSDNPNSDNVLSFQTKHCEFYFDEEVPWTLDGEDGGTPKQVTLDVIPDAVTIYVPKEQE
jgi:YegS/Rv2252/BmrU family lipid kinase